MYICVLREAGANTYLGYLGEQKQNVSRKMRKGTQETGIITVNSEIFARFLFSRNFAYAKFRENITLTKG